MRQYQFYLDRSTPHVAYRWIATAGLFALFALRIVLAQGVSVLIINHQNAMLNNLSSGILVRGLIPFLGYSCLHTRVF